MTSPGPFFGPLGTRTESAPAPSFHLTRRGEYAAAVLVGVVLFGAMWLAAAIGYWITGVPG